MTLPAWLLRFVLMPNREGDDDSQKMATLVARSVDLLARKIACYYA